MKTIEQAANEHAMDRFYSGMKEPNPRVSFKKGVEFAQKWISVEEELPHEEAHVLSIVNGHFGAKDQNSWVVMSVYYLSEFCNFYNHKISHWRPIEIS